MLSAHSIARIKGGDKPNPGDPVIPIVLQVIGNAPVNNGASTKYKLNLTDGVDSIPGMLATQYNEVCNL